MKILFCLAASIFLSSCAQFQEAMAGKEVTVAMDENGKPRIGIIFGK